MRSKFTDSSSWAKKIFFKSVFHERSPKVVWYLPIKSPRSRCRACIRCRGSCSSCCRRCCCCSCSSCWNRCRCGNQKWACDRCWNSCTRYRCSYFCWKGLCCCGCCWQLGWRKTGALLLDITHWGWVRDHARRWPGQVSIPALRIWKNTVTVWFPGTFKSRAIVKRSKYRQNNKKFLQIK